MVLHRNRSLRSGASSTRCRHARSSCTTWPTCSASSGRTSRSLSRRVPTSSPAPRTRPSSAPSAASSACASKEPEERYDLWEAIQRRAFPGIVCNHHLGTLLGLLLAAYEMNHFKAQYQPAVIGNAKAFARALKEQGLDVQGDPAVDFTETHQVIVRVGYGRGPEMAGRWRPTTSSATTRRCPTTRASRPPAPCAWVSRR